MPFARNILHRCRTAIINNRLSRGIVGRLFFEQLINKTGNFSNIKWLGQPVWQNVLDLWTVQEAICEVRPELLIECGTNRAGSAYFYAKLFDLLGQGRIITIDVARLHNLSHPRVEFIVESSVAARVVAQVGSAAKSVCGPVMVILDSDHSAAHVTRELECYSPLVTPGSYLLVQDGVIDKLWTFRHGRPGPLPAIKQFLANHPEFELDDEKNNRFLITHHPSGWLRRRC